MVTLRFLDVFAKIVGMMLRSANGLVACEADMPIEMCELVVLPPASTEEVSEVPSTYRAAVKNAYEVTHTDRDGMIRKVR